jgi:phospholipid/cholesterol/gamma-HCH transport system substrate-binding protein
MKDSYLEVKVGFFVVTGLVLAGIIVVWFGRFEKYFQPTYEIQIKFPNASGLLNGSQVLYRGAKVGFVADPPQISEGGQTVVVRCKINKDVRIADNAKFRVGVYGLLGDRFVDVIPGNTPSTNYLEPGATVEGDRTPGIGDLAEKVGPMIDDLRPIMARVEQMTTRLNDKFITEELATDLHETVRNTKAMIGRLDAILTETQKGESAVGKLLYDKQVGARIEVLIQDLSGLIYSLRKRGPLFYRDVSDVRDGGGNEIQPERPARPALLPPGK